VLGVGVMNRWRGMYLTPTQYPDRYQAPVPIPTCTLASDGINTLSASNMLGCSRGNGCTTALKPAQYIVEQGMSTVGGHRAWHVIECACQGHLNSRDRSIPS